MTQFDLGRLLAPRSIAVVGATPREDVVSTRVMNNVERLGFKGPLWPVNPRYDEVRGRRCHPSLGALPGVPDVVFVAIAAEHVLPVLAEAARLGVAGAIVNASGFADSGPDGAALQQRLVEIAAGAGMAVCGPNNMGFLNLHDGIGLWTAQMMPRCRPGRAALISQSGSVAIAVGEDARRLGFAYLVTAGNEAVCTAADYLAAMVRDERVDVILMFLETIRNPPRFAEAALEAARRGKRIVVVKVGRSEGARAAVAAHTGALSGEDAVYDAFFRRLGIVRASDIDEMIETAALFLKYPDPPEPRGLIAVTLSGGEAALLADVGAATGVTYPPLAPATLAAMKPAFPSFARPRNPLDAWGLGWSAGNFSIMRDALLAEPSSGAIAIALDAPASGTDARFALDMARLCTERQGQHGKRIVFLNNTAPPNVNAEVEALLEAHGIPNLLGMRPGLAALGHWLRRETPRDRQPAARPLPPLARLAEWERMALLADAGVPMAPIRPAASADAAADIASSLGFPVAMKGVAPDILHKTELGLVRLGLADAASVRKAWHELAARLEGRAGSAVVVQKMVPDGLQLLIGARNDPQFGTVVVAGLGGTLVEVMGEVALRIGPVDRSDAEEMLDETRAGRLIAGVRGAGPSDRAAVVDAIVALSQVAAAAPDRIASIEINPLIARPAGHGAIGVDLVLELFPGAD